MSENTYWTLFWFMIIGGIVSIVYIAQPSTEVALAKLQHIEKMTLDGYVQTVIYPDNQHARKTVWRNAKGEELVGL